jgi:hypothetical protein
MLAHPTIDEMPAFNFRTIQKHKDCLSRQIGEAMRIHFSKDQLLNSKNEYLQNCITRVVVQEEKWEARMRERKEEEEEKEDEARLIAFKELKQSIRLEEDPTPQTTPTLDGDTVTGDARDGSEDSLRTGQDTTTQLEVDQEDYLSLWEDAQKVSSLQEEKLSRDCILATPKRRATSPTVRNICKKRKLDLKRKKQTPELSEMNISGWWRRMERMKRDPPRKSNPNQRGRMKHVGQCDYKLAYMSLWWKRMERNEIKEKQDRNLGVRMKAFLMAGKRSGEELIVGLQDHHQVRSNYLDGPYERNVVESFENLEECSFANQNLIIDSRTPPGQYEGTIFSDVTKEHPPTSARPIKKVIQFFEDLSTNQSTGMKRQPQGKLESPAKYVRTMGSYGKGLSRNYVRDIQQINPHNSSEGEGVMEYIHAQDQTEGDANDGGLSRSSSSQSSEPAL